MAIAKVKDHSQNQGEKRADEEAAIAAHIHFAVTAVCGWVESLHSKLHKKAA